MICSQEIPVPGSMPRVIRVLLHAASRGAPHHVYLRGAQALRPDLHHGVPFAQPGEARPATKARRPARKAAGKNGRAGKKTAASQQPRRPRPAGRRTARGSRR